MPSCSNTAYPARAICGCGHEQREHASTIFEDALDEPCDCGHCGSCMGADCACSWFSEDVDATLEGNEDQG